MAYQDSNKWSNLSPFGSGGSYNIDNYTPFKATFVVKEGGIYYLVRTKFIFSVSSFDNVIKDIIRVVSNDYETKPLSTAIANGFNSQAMMYRQQDDIIRNIDDKPYITISVEETNSEYCNNRAVLWYKASRIKEINFFTYRPHSYASLKQYPSEGQPILTNNQNKILLLL